MTDAKRDATIILLVNDAVESERGSHSKAALMLVDAALSIIATRHTSPTARREVAGMIADYVGQQIEAVIAAGGGA